MRGLSPLALLCVLGILLPHASAADTAAAQSTVVVTISNTNRSQSPGVDAHDQPLDAHDGNILWVDGAWWWWAVGYGDCKGQGCQNNTVGACGFRLNHTVNAFRSTDLVHWTLVGDALPVASRPAGIYYWPKVVYNPVTKQFVMWINRVLDHFRVSPYMSAVSDTPQGPFTLVNLDIATRYGRPGSVDLYVDEDSGKGYVIYTSLDEGHRVSIEQLNDNFTAALPETNQGLFGASFVEAPVLFKRNNVFYVLWGTCCCFCTPGTDIQFYRSTQVDRGYAYVSDPGCKDPMPGSWHTCTAGSTTGSQLNSVFHVPGTDQWILIGQRWQSAPDGLKSHDFNYLAPLSFDANGNIEPMPFLDSFNVTLPTRELPAAQEQ